VIDIHYASIRNLDISNGQGVGISLFIQGCKFHCYNCFNPETWDFNGGKEWTEETKNKFLELAARPYIKRVSLLGGECLAEENLNGVLDLVTEIRKRYNSPKADSKNPWEIKTFKNENPDKIRLLYGNTKAIWLYTGYDFDQLKDNYNLYKYTPLANESDKWLTRWEIISQCDVLVDGRYIDSLKDPSLKWCGSSNQRVIDVQESIRTGEVVLYDTKC
jgi:anaerobic ribonucleoside-triphosphate reductase activating protein